MIALVVSSKYLPDMVTRVKLQTQPAFGLKGGRADDECGGGVRAG